MSHFGDSMDDVPVKISEKYKRPPRIDLPYSVVECPIRAQNIVDSVKYCSTFEQNVLSKLKELRSAKETKKNERRHRLQLLEEAKQKKLDAIAAAEAEEKLKQLSVSEVSYPSTDEISALSPDDKNDKTCEAVLTQENGPELDNVTEPEYSICTTQEQPNILQPIQIQSTYHHNNLLDDPDPLQEYKMNVTKMPHSSQNVDTMTFKDFENDTSSPFDNVELKTINDMELLAQVLQSQRESTSNVMPQVYNPEQSYSNCGTQSQLGTVPYLPNAYAEQTIQGSNVMFSPQHYPLPGGYYVSPETICDNTMPMDNIYVPNYQYFVPAPSYTATPFYNNQLPSNSGEIQMPQYYYQYPQAPMPYVANSYNTVQEVQNQEEIASVTSLSAVKSRSRSVPDIVKELNQELEFAKQRTNERSYNASPAPVKVPRSHSNSEKKEQRRKRKEEKVEILPNPFEKFPQNIQSMCQKIHGMGFPLDRVARVCNLVGDNDKKIIECLLVMGELMDLGFSEARVSAALAKHEFNRDKALDELVS